MVKWGERCYYNSPSQIRSFEIHRAELLWGHVVRLIDTKESNIKYQSYYHPLPPTISQIGSGAQEQPRACVNSFVFPKKVFENAQLPLEASCFTTFYGRTAQPLCVSPFTLLYTCTQLPRGNFTLVFPMTGCNRGYCVLIRACEPMLGLILCFSF